MAASVRKINLAGTALDGSRHFCAFFHDQNEELRTFLPFIREGLTAREKALHFVNAETRDRYRDRLREAGIDVAPAEQSGQLDVVAWPDDHMLDGGESDPE